MKDKNRIINEMVANTADVLEAKAEEVECIAEQYEAKGDIERATDWRKDLPAIRSAVEIMRLRAGCWA